MLKNDCDFFSHNFLKIIIVEKWRWWKKYNFFLTYFCVVMKMILCDKGNFSALKKINLYSISINRYWNFHGAFKLKYDMTDKYCKGGGKLSI